MRWLALGALVLGVLSMEARVHACSCMRQSPEEAIAAAEALFEASVTAVSDNTKTDFRGRAVTLAVGRVWKGVEGSEVTAITASSSAACGYPFQVGESYLVYGYRSRAGDLHVSLCSHTKRIDDAKADLKLLGKPKPASTTKSKKADKGEGGCSAVPAEAPAGSGLALVLMALAIARVRRQPALPRSLRR
ncbi:MAG: MYXO-CTERM sorting domain-containing protein [Myxococcota bacterium]